MIPPVLAPVRRPGRLLLGVWAAPLFRRRTGRGEELARGREIFFGRDGSSLLGHEEEVGDAAAQVGERRGAGQFVVLFKNL